MSTSKTNKANSPRIGTRFRDWRLDGPYDAVIVGSGMGGLSTAAFLSELGWKVAVLEQHYTAGGYTHSYERKGYEWDVGLHYIGEMGSLTLARRLMDFITGGQLQWASLGSIYDRFFIGDKVFEAKAGKRAYRDELVSRFPQEAKAIDAYLVRIAKVRRLIPLFAAAKLLLPWQRKWIQPVLKMLLPREFNMTTGAVMAEVTSDRDLTAVLTGQWGDHGLPPGQSSFIIHALVASHYLEGAFFPVGGSWRIADTILPKIRAAGGEVFTYARVKQILVEQGKTQGVLMEDGTRIDCACVVSSAGAVNTFKHLLSPVEAARAGYDKLLPKVSPSTAHLGVYIGLKQTAQALGLPKTNFWIYPSNDYDGVLQRFVDDKDAPLPVVYISFPSAKDPDFERRYPGKATVEIVAPCTYAWFEKWETTIWGKRGDDYESVKAQWGERLMAVLYEKMPQLQGQVDYFEVSTPLSTNWFSGYQRGEAYGLSHDPQRFKQDWLGPRSKIDGLWLTGQDVMSVGIVGAMVGGTLTATAIAGVRRMGPLLAKLMMRRRA